VPFDSGRLVFPPVATACFLAIFYPMFRIFLPTAVTDALIAGVLCGYVCYDMIHYYLHYGSPRKGSYFDSLRGYHVRHHFESPHLGKLRRMLHSRKMRYVVSGCCLVCYVIGCVAAKPIEILSSATNAVFVLRLLLSSNSATAVVSWDIVLRLKIDVHGVFQYRRQFPDILSFWCSCSEWRKALCFASIPLR